MKKIAKIVGRALAFTFTADEIKIYGIKEGEVYDIEINHQGLPSSKKRGKK